MKSSPLNALADQCHAISSKSGFHPCQQTRDAFVEAFCNNEHDEVSELHESWRNRRLLEPCDKAEKMAALKLPALTCAEEELADIIIRALDAAKQLGIDIDRAVQAKCAYNSTRAYRHGDKLS